VDWRGHVTTDPAILIGKPILRGTRLSVELVLELVAAGWSFEEILTNYPGLTVEAIRACFAYARDVVADRRARLL